MSKYNSPLENVRIASPCSADWNQMFGDDRKRFCGECKLNVYNLSGTSREEAEALLVNAEGRLCVRLYKRNDGTVITTDCPVGWRAAKQRVKAVAAAAFSLLIALFTGVFFVSLLSSQRSGSGKFIIPISRPTPEPLMGAVAYVPTKPRKDLD